MSAYIEDPDAGGVIYNPNYLRAYERTLQVDAQNHDGNRNGSGPSTALEDDAWTFVQVDEQKFKCSPVISFCIYK